MRKTIYFWITSIVFVSFCTNAIAEVLPKSGKINLQSIYKGTSITKFNDDYSHGTVTGVTFNEMGKGPMHLGKTACSFSVFSHNNINKIIGFCALEDKNGDKVFIQYAGSSSTEGEWDGQDEIIGGTGIYQGIQGSGPYSCANTDEASEFPCRSTLEYRLP